MNIAMISDKARPVFQKYGFKKVGIFGSRARGDNMPESDVDLLFSFADTKQSLDIFTIEAELAETLGTPVDLVDGTRVISRMRPRIKQDLKIIYEG